MGSQLVVVPKDIDHLKHQIAQEWQHVQQAALSSFIRIGQCILRAEQQLGIGSRDYYEFLNGLPFSQSHAVKFKALAQHPEISKTSNLEKLPHSIFSLYQLSLLDPNDLQKGLATGAINAHTTRQEIAAYRQKAANTTPYEPFCTILLSSNMTSRDKASLLASVSTALKKYPKIQFKLSKKVVTEGLAALNAQAHQEYDKLMTKFPDETRRFSSLVDHAIEAIRKSPSKTLPKDFGRRDQLKRDLGIDIAQEVRQAQVYQAARQHKVISRFLPLAKHDPHVKLWAYVIEWCETGNPKRLKRFSEEQIHGKITPKTAEKKKSIAHARQLLDEHHTLTCAA